MPLRMVHCTLCVLSMLLYVCLSQNSNTSVVVGFEHTCLETNGQMRCWGNGAFGQLGANSPSNFGSSPESMSLIVPTPFLPSLGKVTQMSAGWYHSCVLFEIGKIVCFGENSIGHLGIGNTMGVGCGGSCLSITLMNGLVFPTPTVLATAVSSGAQHSCALFMNGKVRW